jgi:hypothetical protein
VFVNSVSVVIVLGRWVLSTIKLSEPNFTHKNGVQKKRDKIIVYNFTAS